MSGTGDWTEALGIDTSEDVHVAEPREGVFVFYTEFEEEYLRSDCTVNVTEHR